MARTYAPRSVLRHLPLELLRTFLNLSDVPLGLDWDALVEGDTPAIYQAWFRLPTGPRERVEQMMQHVHEMASHTGVQGVITEAAYQGHEIGGTLDAIPGLHAKALWALIHYPDEFRTARLLLSAGSPFGRYWNLTTGFGGTPFDVTETTLRSLRAATARLYREQGRGQQCTIEPYDRGGCLYLFLYLDDYTQTHTAHNSAGHLVRSPVRPAFEVVYLYSPGDGTLNLYAHGDRRWRSALRDLFCEHVLHRDAPATDLVRRSYDLRNVIRRDFPLRPDPARGVLAAAIHELRIVHAAVPNRRVTLSPDPTAGPWDVYDMLDAHFPVARFPRSELLVNGVTFRVTFRLPGDERDRPLTFSVSFPDACNLRSMPDDRREIGEWCLREWRILNDRPAD
jgi:hypothetical protein